MKAVFLPGTSLSYSILSLVPPVKKRVSPVSGSSMLTTQAEWKGLRKPASTSDHSPVLGLYFSPFLF